MNLARFGEFRLNMLKLISDMDKAHRLDWNDVSFCVFDAPLPPMVSSGATKVLD